MKRDSESETERENDSGIKRESVCERERETERLSTKGLYNAGVIYKEV